MRVASIALGLVLLAGCSTEPPVQVAVSPSPTTSTATPDPAPTPTETATPSPTATVTATPVPSRPSARPTPAETAVPAVRRTCPGLSGLSGTQVLLVQGVGSAATIRACEKQGDVWVSVMGTMTGNVGRRGVAPPGEKREGDLRTPSGTFTLGRGFGQRANPGISFGWRVTDSKDVWVDDPESSLYNTWQRLPADGRWDSAEPLDVPSYAYAQVIDYNTARTPGRGSAIFLHVGSGRGTLGCVSMPVSSLLKVFRWERPGARIVIR